MSGHAWVTHREAAEMLGVHISLIPKMLRRGDLTSRIESPSLSRRQVLELAATRAAEAAARAAEAAARAAEAAERERRRATPRPATPRPPDEQHEWLLAPLAAVVLGCSEIALHGRASRGQVPFTLHGGRRWFRLDLLELLLRARAALRTLNE